jgi:methyltransferase (TIGR00027 family)
MGKDEYEEMHHLIRTGFDGSKSYTAEQTDEVIAEYMSPIPLSRLPFCESRLERFAKEHGKIQYVICGAGSDTFSFRNANDDIEIFEVDHPDTQRAKLEKIKKLEWHIRDNVHFVSVDFEKERMTEKLLAAGFDPEKKSFFSILGVTYYLSLPTFTETLSQIAELSQTGSAVVFDYPQKTGKFPPRVNELSEITRSLGETMSGGYDYQEVSRALYSLGFQIDTFLNPAAVQEKYFGGRTDGLKAFENVNLLSAVYTGGYDFE